MVGYWAFTECLNDYYHFVLNYFCNYWDKWPVWVVLTRPIFVSVCFPVSRGGKITVITTLLSWVESKTTNYPLGHQGQRWESGAPVSLYPIPSLLNGGHLGEWSVWNSSCIYMEPFMPPTIRIRAWWEQKCPKHLRLSHSDVLYVNVICSEYFNFCFYFLILLPATIACK